MTIHNLSERSSVLNRFIAEIRDENIQKDTTAPRVLISLKEKNIKYLKRLNIFDINCQV